MGWAPSACGSNYIEGNALGWTPPNKCASNTDGKPKEGPGVRRSQCSPRIEGRELSGRGCLQHNGTLLSRCAEAGRQKRHLAAMHVIGRSQTSQLQCSGGTPKAPAPLVFGDLLLRSAMASRLSELEPLPPKIPTHGIREAGSGTGGPEQSNGSPCARLWHVPPSHRQDGAGDRPRTTDLATHNDGFEFC